MALDLDIATCPTIYFHEDLIRHDVKQAIDILLDRIEDEDKPKDIVTLRNLEVTPPPQPSVSEELAAQIPPTPTPRRSRQANKRQLDQDESIGSSRTKRQRKQTELFQVHTPANKQPRQQKTPVNKNTTNTISRPTSTRKFQANLQQQQQAPQIQQQQPHNPQVIFYEKDDYLAIRNEENSFYICQLVENVRVQRPLIKIRWLDTRDDGKTYHLTSHYDKIPQKSIIMPVILNKLKSAKRGEQLFLLEDQHRDNIIERLKRSLNIPVENE